MSAGGVNYTYDGDGNRVMKSSGTIYCGGGGSGALAESDLSGNIQQEYVFFNGKRLARVDNTNDTMHFYFADHLGSTSDVTDAVGNILEESDYYPYGGEMPVITGDSNHYKFTGKERDTESGLDEFGARYDSSALGRFMTPDWAARPTAVPYAAFGDPQSLNLYGYVRNDPVSNADPDGHEVGYEYGPDSFGMRNGVSAQAHGQYAQGSTKVAVGAGLILTAAGGDLPGGAVGALLVTNAVIGGASATVDGTMQIMGAATHTDTSEASKVLNATGTYPGLVTVAATGNVKAGETVSTVTNAATLAASPKEAVKNPATTVDAVQTVKETTGLVQSTINAVKNWFATPAPPPPPPTPSVPDCASGACNEKSKNGKK